MLYVVDACFRTNNATIDLSVVLFPMKLETRCSAASVAVRSSLNNDSFQ